MNRGLGGTVGSIVWRTTGIGDSLSMALEIGNSVFAIDIGLIVSWYWLSYSCQKSRNSMELGTRARDIVVIDIGSMTILCCRCSFILWGRFYIYIRKNFYCFLFCFILVENLVMYSVSRVTID